MFKPQWHPYNFESQVCLTEGQLVSSFCPSLLNDWLKVSEILLKQSKAHIQKKKVCFNCDLGGMELACQISLLKGYHFFSQPVIFLQEKTQYMKIDINCTDQSILFLQYIHNLIP